MIKKLKEKIQSDIKYVAIIIFVAGIIVGVLAGPPALKAFGLNVVSDDLTRQQCGQIMLECQDKIGTLEGRVALLEQQVCMLTHKEDNSVCFK